MFLRFNFFYVSGLPAHFNNIDKTVGCITLVFYLTYLKDVIKRG